MKSVKIIFKSGKEVVFECQSAKFTMRNGAPCGYEIAYSPGYYAVIDIGEIAYACVVDLAEDKGR